jgi:hypothetical protein
VTVYLDDATGTLLAAQMGAKGETTILPQIVARLAVLQAAPGLMAIVHLRPQSPGE